MASQFPNQPIRQKGERTKRKETSRAKRSHSKAEEAHLDRLAAIGCVLCVAKGGPISVAEIHHIRTGTGAGRRSSHFDAIPLCVSHHRHGKEALHAIGRRAFERLHKITELELLVLTKELLK